MNVIRYFKNNNFLLNGGLLLAGGAAAAVLMKGPSLSTITGLFCAFLVPTMALIQRFTHPYARLCATLTKFAKDAKRSAVVDAMKTLSVRQREWVMKVSRLITTPVTVNGVLSMVHKIQSIPLSERDETLDLAAPLITPLFSKSDVEEHIEKLYKIPKPQRKEVAHEASRLMTPYVTGEHGQIFIDKIMKMSVESRPQLIDQMRRLISPQLKYDGNDILNIFQLVEGEFPVEKLEETVTQLLPLITPQMRGDQILRFFQHIAALFDQKKGVEEIKEIIDLACLFEAADRETLLGYIHRFLPSAQRKEIVLLTRAMIPPQSRLTARKRGKLLLAVRDTPASLRGTITAQVLPKIRADFSLHKIEELISKERLKHPFIVSMQSVRDNPGRVLLDMHNMYGDSTLLKLPPKVQFEKDGQDEGGVTRQFITSLMRELHREAIAHSPSGVPMKLHQDRCIPLLVENHGLSMEDQIKIYQFLGVILASAFLRDRSILIGAIFHPVFYEILHAFRPTELARLSPDAANIPPDIEEKCFQILSEHYMNLSKEEANQIWKDQLSDETNKWSGCNSKAEFLEAFKLRQMMQACLIVARSSFERMSFNAKATWPQLKGEKPEDLRLQIEGSLSKEQVLEALRWEGDYVNVQQHLKQWIEKATDEQLKLFVLAITGCETLAPDDELRIEALEAREDGTSKDRFPTYQTCSKKMSVFKGFETALFKKKLEESFTCLHGAGFQMA